MLRDGQGLFRIGKGLVKVQGTFGKTEAWFAPAAALYKGDVDIPVKFLSIGAGKNIREPRDLPVGYGIGKQSVTDRSQQCGVFKPVLHPTQEQPVLRAAGKPLVAAPKGIDEFPNQGSVPVRVTNQRQAVHSVKTAGVGNVLQQNAGC